MIDNFLRKKTKIKPKNKVAEFHRESFQNFLSFVLIFFIFLLIIFNFFWFFQPNDYNWKGLWNYLKPSSQVKGEEDETLKFLSADGSIKIEKTEDGIYFLSLNKNSVYDYNIAKNAVEKDELARRSVYSYHIATNQVNSRIIKDKSVDSADLDSTITIRNYLRIGENNPSHFSLGRGDLFVSDNLEVDDDAYFDSTIYVRDSSSISTMTSDTLQTETANISNILSNSNLAIKGRLPEEDFFNVYDFVNLYFHPSGYVYFGDDAHETTPANPTYAGNGDVYIKNDLEVGGVIYGSISGAYAPSGDLDMNIHIISNIGNAGTDFDASGGLTLASDLTAPNVVYSVSGTTNRIISAGGQNPVIDISSGYQGQSSITTLGTIITGVWNGTSIVDANIDNNLTIAGGIISGASNIMSLGSDAVGDIYYRNDSGYLTRLSIGTSAQVLHGGTTPGYGAITAGDITADSLDFTEFKDTMSLDTSTDVALAENNFTFSGSGNVGIGTTSPEAKLHVNNLITANLEAWFTSGYGSFIKLKTQNGQSRITFGSNMPLLFDSDDLGTTRMLISNTGNVGIGTTSPTAKLDISAGNLNLDSTTNANQFGVISKNGTRFIHDFNYGNNGTVTTDGLNTFVGFNAGNLTMGSTATSNYQSSYNTGVGYQSLYSNTTGFRNTANGMDSLYRNTTGYSNTANGFQSL
ncbi:MAG: hypothetical protein CO138_00690, partial [Candidatus Moranbacteria bacterium CG_4_9_14_3_um_filter_33_15]